MIGQREWKESTKVSKKWLSWRKGEEKEEKRRGVTDRERVKEGCMIRKVEKYFIKTPF